VTGPLDGGFFDAHLRASSLGPRDVADLRFFGVEGALCPLPGGEAPATAPLLRRAWEELGGRSVKALRRAGLGAFAALAVPPDRVPARGLDALLAELPDFLSRRGVAAIGPVGLGAGTPRDEEVLSRQLEMARELRRPVLVTTPAREALRAIRRVLAILRESGLEPGRVLLDGVDSRTVKIVRAVGYGAVLSLSAGPDGVEEAARTVRELGPEGIALASHAGDGLGDLLAIPRAADRMSRLGLSDAVIRRVCGRNALAALGLEPSAVRSAAAPIARSVRRPSR
jgi:predicted metal-dependent TIM-barrel fold hydrolase